MRHLIGYTRNTIPVFVDLIHSEAAKHIARQPSLLTLAAEALGYATLLEPTVSLEQDMGRTIGYDLVIATAETDAVFYAQLIRDKFYTRFVKGAKPLSTPYLTMLLDRSPDGTHYALHNVWIGRSRPPQPGSSEETNKSNSFWEKHAVIFENQPIQPRTLTKARPS